MCADTDAISGERPEACPLLLPAPGDVLATTVGGNRYGWFTSIDIGSDPLVDNHTLPVIPLPTASALAGLALVATGAHRRHR